MREKTHEIWALIDVLDSLPVLDDAASRLVMASAISEHMRMRP
jgi:hypothetical protein